MIQSNVNTPTQAVPLIEGKVNLGAGTYVVNSIIHCEVDGEITFGPNATSYVMTAGMDRAFSGTITVLDPCIVTID